MLKRKKFLQTWFLFLTAAVLLFCMVLMAGCGDGLGQYKQKEEKYDVVVKVKNSLGEEWIFDLETKKLSVEYEYTGQEIDFYVDSYNTPYHPQYSENWHSLHAGINNEFYSKCYYYNVDGKQEYVSSYCSVEERGTYICYFMVDTYGTHNMQLKYRVVILNIAVK